MTAKFKAYAFSVIVPRSVIFTAGLNTLSPVTAFGIFSLGVMSIDGFNHLGLASLYWNFLLVVSLSSKTAQESPVQ